MRCLFCFVVALATAGCQISVEVRAQRPQGYDSRAQIYHDLPLTIHHTRVGVTKGGTFSATATWAVYGAKNYSRGMCYLHWYQGKRIYKCTSRYFLDRQSFSKILGGRKLSRGACGLEIPVYHFGHFYGCRR